jgi:hypothetical protein
MTYTAAPSPKGTNYSRLYITNRPPVRLAHDEDPRNQREGLDRRRGGRDRRPFGRDDDPLSDRLDQLQEHLQNVIEDPADLSQANDLVSQLLEAMPKGGEDEASNSGEEQRRDPNLFLQVRRKATGDKLSSKDWDTFDQLCRARDKRAKDNGDPGDRPNNRMAGDRALRQEPKLADPGDRRD